MSHSSSPATSQPSTALALVAADLAAVEAKMRGNEQDIFPPLAEAFLSLITLSLIHISEPTRPY